MYSIVKENIYITYELWDWLFQSYSVYRDFKYCIDYRIKRYVIDIILCETIV